VGNKVAFLSILPVIQHDQPTYYQWTLPRKTGVFQQTASRMASQR
jgi:hypothetical protein